MAQLVAINCMHVCTYKDSLLSLVHTSQSKTPNTCRFGPQLDWEHHVLVGQDV